MVVTVTLNPAVDQTLFLDGLAVGEINRARASQLDPAGKGINVSRVVDRLGWPTVAFGFVAGEVGEIVRRALDAEGVQQHFVTVPGQTRLNVHVVEEWQRQETSIHAPGPEIAQEHWRELHGLLDFWLRAARVLVLAGSIPQGLPDTIYADLVAEANRAGVKTILDADGEPLRLGVAAKPYLIKPNADEAAALLGRPLTDLPAILAGARELCNQGIRVVVISMGAQGAICAEGKQAWRVTPPPVEAHSNVGSGDSLVAGLAVALSRDEPILEGMRLGTAAGAATAMTPGTALGTASEVQALLPGVQVQELT